GAALRCHNADRLSSNAPLARQVACGDPHSPVAFRRQSPAEVLMDGVQAVARVATARSFRSTDHRAMLLALNGLFRAGRVPQAPLDGAYAGAPVTTIFGRAADVACGALGRVYMPWRGKAFDAAAHGGGNLFTARSTTVIPPL